ncbi:IclR family transcriptional regulator [Pseudomonas sp. M30-35]|uniref:IclR family transcriptional regulator n=1 Tax=Pseudomonas sp. M30-35 TaxID=1981174 RepID=UPI000B3C18EA|nr:IclR family transcriptional regulator [Pseudomonas sp. M30-35]ARU90139.1 hypothetical protein B9K09_20250 [Pseudomonas sp. M30-35]
MTEKKPQQEKPKTDRYSAPALDKGLDIIELLAVSDGPISQTEIARTLGRGVNEIYRMLDTLVRRRYIVTTGSGDRYQLSLKMLTLVNAYPPMQRLKTIAEPIMRSFAREAYQSCHLAVWDDGNVVVENPVISPGVWQWSLRNGAHIGLYNSGSGKVLAAFQPEDVQRQMIEKYCLVAGEQPLATDEFLAKLEVIRRQGFVREASITAEGIVNMSYPILDFSGRVICSLTCPFVRHIDTTDAPDEDHVFALFTRAAQALTDQLIGERSASE